MGPHPHLIRLSLEQIEQVTPAQDVTEHMVQGKVMELKGIQLQKGLTQTMSVNMSYHQYCRRMGYELDQGDALKPKVIPEEPGMSKDQAQTVLEAAAGYIKEKGIDHLDVEEFQKHVKDQALKKTHVLVPKAKSVKKERAVSSEMAVEVLSSEDEKEWQTK